MSPRLLLEISVDSLEKALAAEHGGAGRLELCANLAVGGLTPPRELLHAVREKVHIPVYSMIRPRPGNFVYSDVEFTEMERSIAVAAKCGMDGVVLGVLKKNRGIDMARTRKFVDLARPLPVTFHRAFDETPDLARALEAVIQTGAARILTSAGAKTALQGAAKLAELVAAARDRVSDVGSRVQPDRIIIVPGAGITLSNIAKVAEQTGAIEFHAGLGSVLPYSTHDFAAFESEVHELADQLAHLP